jgi:two-component system chemotaxis response regulator CheB
MILPGPARRVATMARPGAEPTGLPSGTGPIDLIVVGASLGGPVALEKVCSGLPRGLPAPVVVCQHIAPGMVKVLADRLDRLSPLSIGVAEHGQTLEAGAGYVTPIGRQARVSKDEGVGRIRLYPDFADSLHVPSIDVLFSSAAMSYGSCTMGVLLTGMGTDGALGLLAIRRAGGYTLAESEETAASYSMPGSARELGAVAAEARVDHVAEMMLARIEAGEEVGETGLR